MDFRSRIAATLHGGRPDYVPFAPYDNLFIRGSFEPELRNQGVGLTHRLSSIWSEMQDIHVEHRQVGDTLWCSF